jgi:hypothetical protein
MQRHSLNFFTTATRGASSSKATTEQEKGGHIAEECVKCAVEPGQTR